MSQSKLDKLLAAAKFQPSGNYVNGLDPLRSLLDRDSDGGVQRSLTNALPKLPPRERSGVAFLLADHCWRAGNPKDVRGLYEQFDDAQVRASILNGLWGKPRDAEDGAWAVAVAIDATRHAAPEVRTQACHVLQNQCAWGVDVAAAIPRLQSLLSDDAKRVRHQAAYAVGNFAKQRYDMSALIPELCRNLKHDDMYVREANAWTLWHVSRAKHDITSAVPALVGLLNDPEDYNEIWKKSIGALLHHAKKSKQHSAQVRATIKGVKLKTTRKEVKKFLDQLSVIQ